MPPTREELQQLAREIAAEEGLDPDFFDRHILLESSYRPDAVSPKGAIGLGQLMPRTAAELGVANPFDPEQNLRGAARYLRSMRDMFGGNMLLGAAAYNAGPGAVKRFGGVPPYAETIKYVRDRGFDPSTGASIPFVLDPSSDPQKPIPMVQSDPSWFTEVFGKQGEAETEAPMVDTSDPLWFTKPPEEIFGTQPGQLPDFAAAAPSQSWGDIVSDIIVDQLDPLNLALLIASFPAGGLGYRIGAKIASATIMGRTAFHTAANTLVTSGKVATGRSLLARVGEGVGFNIPFAAAELFEEPPEDSSRIGQFARAFAFNEAIDIAAIGLFSVPFHWVRRGKHIAEDTFKMSKAAGASDERAMADALISNIASLKRSGVPADQIEEILNAAASATSESPVALLHRLRVEYGEAFVARAAQLGFDPAKTMGSLDELILTMESEQLASQTLRESSDYTARKLESFAKDVEMTKKWTRWNKRHGHLDLEGKDLGVTDADIMERINQEFFISQLSRHPETPRPPGDTLLGRVSKHTSLSPGKRVKTVRDRLLKARLPQMSLEDYYLTLGESDDKLIGGLFEHLIENEEAERLFVDVLDELETNPSKFPFPPEISRLIAKMERIMGPSIAKELRRFRLTKLAEARDARRRAAKQPHIEALTRALTRFTEAGSPPEPKTPKPKAGKTRGPKAQVPGAETGPKSPGKVTRRKLKGEQGSISVLALSSGSGGGFGGLAGFEPVVEKDPDTGEDKVVSFNLNPGKLVIGMLGGALVGMVAGKTPKLFRLVSKEIVPGTKMVGRQRVYGIVENGEEIGELMVAPTSTGELYIDWVGLYPPGKQWAAPVSTLKNAKNLAGRVGISGIRQLSKQLLSEFPETTHFSGERITGTAAKRGLARPTSIKAKP